MANQKGSFAHNTQNVTNDADFRAYAQALHDMFALAGWIQTGDTGQINLTTVLRPAANTSGGYEIWRFDDALQATFPIFVKIEYRASAAQTTAIIHGFTGTGSNGAGTLTGQLSQVSPGPMINNQPGSPSVTVTTGTTYWCGDKDYICCIMQGDQVANKQNGFVIERPIYDSGVVSDRGVYIHGWSSIAGYGQFVPSSGTPPAGVSQPSVLNIQNLYSGGAGMGAFGTDVAILSIPLMAGKYMTLRSMLIANTSQFATTTPVSVTRFGVVKSYKPIPTAGPPQLSAVSGQVLLFND